MEIILNELSLDGSFQKIEDFYDSLNEIIKIQKVMLASNLFFLKHQELYSYKVTDKLSLFEVFKDKRSRSNNELRKFKILLNSLMSDPIFWHENQKHRSKDIYICKYTNLTNDYSLAEACERDRVVLSFFNTKFSSDLLEVKKNDTEIDLININDSNVLCELLYEKSLIDARTYCDHKFTGTNLSFKYLEKEYDFNILQDEEEKIFISSFKNFSEKSWDEVIKSDGLNYKKYQPSKKKNWFSDSSYENKQIYKFKTNEKCRCFGFREGDIFYVLRFERDHVISDNG